MSRKFTPERIDELKPDEIFVFGSNMNGAHMGGAARIAYENFEATWGESEGLTGRSYAIPTLDENMEKVSESALEASIEFIPAKRPHRLHNHPRMEVELGLNEREVIVDQEFVHLFRNAYPVRGRRREVGVDHFIVSKKEFLERMEESRGGNR